MLVLSRKSLEAVVVGGSAGFEHMLKVTVLEIRGSYVRLGFDVHASVPVHRLEVWERIQAGAGMEIAPRGPPPNGVMTPGLVLQPSTFAVAPVVDPLPPTLLSG